MKERTPTSWRIKPFYCVRELEDGTRCGHHADVHRGGMACQAMGPYGDPCLCTMFLAVKGTDRVSP